MMVVDMIHRCHSWVRLLVSSLGSIYGTFMKACPQEWLFRSITAQGFWGLVFEINGCCCMTKLFLGKMLHTRLLTIGRESMTNQNTDTAKVQLGEPMSFI